VVLELPGVDKDAIEVKATDRSLVISAERRNLRQLPAQPAAEAGEASGEEAQPVAVAERAKSPLISEFRYGTWSRSFRFPQPIERDQLEARHSARLVSVCPSGLRVSALHFHGDRGGLVGLGGLHRQ